jgi:hypothetical protein
MCCSEIDARAKKCPKCTSLQAKFSNLENNPILIGILFLFIIGMFGYVFYQNFYVSELEDEAVKNLNVTVTDISTKNETDALYVACIGNITNDAEFNFKQIKFQVDFLSQENKLIDTFSVTDEDLGIPSNSITNFRVRGLGQKQASEYKKCVVKVVDAWSH